MKTNIRKIVSSVTLIALLGSNLTFINQTSAASNKIIFPLKEVSKLECRFTEFDDLSKDCKQSLPILQTKDYNKYIKKNGGYNDYTRFYTVLWGSSYKYGWDVGFGGHQGVDIASSKGTPIYSIADGKVIVAKKALGWGNVVTVEHLIDGKKVFSNYAHMSKILVKKGDRVKIGKKIGEVGSTGNSTGNHLHFQIDLDTPFHPYYYDYKACPYSYNKISEEGVCFDELEKNTIDPILFLETNGDILNKIKTTSKISRVTNPTKIYDSSKNYDKDGVSKVKTNYNKSIFSKTVYIGYAKSDIREVQQILRDLELYNGNLTGDYKDIENIIYKFQVRVGILSQKSDNGAGWFGPQTRAAIKKEYDKFLKSGKKKNYVTISNTSKNSNGIVTKKIERKQIKTREEIEKMEYDNFIKSNNFNFNLKTLGGNIPVGTTASINFGITKKGRDKPFKGNTPLDITIETDSKILDVFPKKFYNFSSGGREIKLTGKKSGIAYVKIKFGSTTIKSYKIRVYGKSEAIYLDSVGMYGRTKVVLGNREKGIGLFKDSSNNKLINIEYKGNYLLEGVGDTKVCIKKGSIKNISRIYNRVCRPDEYTDKIYFSYKDTVAGVLLYDYKSTGTDAKIKIINTYNNQLIGEKKLLVSEPKGLKSNYVYKDDIITLLKNDVATIGSKGYFLEDRALSEYDSKIWIRNTLNKIKSDTYDEKLKNDINKKIIELNNEPSSKTNTLTRKDFLEKSYIYLNFNNGNNNLSINYRDLDKNLSNKVGVLFDNNITWKDKFGDNYFQPDKKLTRGEAAFLLNQVLIRSSKTYLTVR